MISRTTFCFVPRGDDAAGPHGPDAGHIPQAVRLGLDDVEDLVAKFGHQLPGVDGTDPRNRP